VDCYRQLAKQLQSVCPVFGIQAPFLAEEEQNFSDIKQLADYYVEQIISHRKNGPYRLAGWSLGGRVAQKMLERLQELEKEVDYFAVIDTHMISQEEQKILSPYQSLVNAFWVFVTDISETQAQRQNYQKILKTLPVKIRSMKLNEQIETVADQLLSQSFHTHLQTKQQIVLALKYAVNLMTEKRTLNVLSLPFESVLFIASKSDEQLVKRGWNKAIASKTAYVKIEGEHSSLLSGISFEQIKNKLRKDLIIKNNRTDNDTR
jgi:thioesterase domain-containing protein